jgi:hypothetical protein
MSSANPPPQVHNMQRQDVWQSHSEEADGLNTSDSGNCYFTQSWLSINIQTKWRITDFQPGINQFNQDIYVMERI